MTLTQVLLATMSGSLGAVLLALIGWLVNRQVNRSKAGDQDASALERKANARKVDAEVWGMMSSDLVETVERLTNDMVGLRTEVGELKTTNRKALEHITEVHEWDAGGRRGPMPRVPAGLRLSVS